MGVQNLWQVLQPVGYRVDVETLTGKTLAVDASIWLTQFIKAMREEGSMVRNAHILGSLRRILKLLHHKIKPIFVFDGGAPVLKLRILSKRRQVRAAHTSAIKETAHKLLLNQMVSATLSKAAALKDKQYNPKSGLAPGFKLPTAQRNKQVVLENRSNRKMETEAIDVHDDSDNKEEEEDDSDEIIWSSDSDSANDENDKEGVKTSPIDLTLKESDSSFAKERIHEDEHETVDDIVAQISNTDGNVNLKVVSELPDTLQYATIARLKDLRRQRDSKRSDFIPLAGDPMKYSQLQLAHFLKDSHFKKKLDRMEENLAKRGGEGKRIASDPNREYLLVDSAVSKMKPNDLPSPSNSLEDTLKSLRQEFSPGTSLSSSINTNPKNLEKNKKRAVDEMRITITEPNSNTTLKSDILTQLVAAQNTMGGMHRDMTKVLDSETERKGEIALQTAMKTASNLTSWAAIAVRRAIQKNENKRKLEKLSVAREEPPPKKVDLVRTASTQVTSTTTPIRSESGITLKADTNENMLMKPNLSFRKNEHMENTERKSVSDIVSLISDSANEILVKDLETQVPKNESTKIASNDSFSERLLTINDGSTIKQVEDDTLEIVGNNKAIDNSQDAKVVPNSVIHPSSCSSTEIVDDLEGIPKLNERHPNENVSKALNSYPYVEKPTQKATVESLEANRETDSSCLNKDLPVKTKESIPPKVAGRENNHNVLKHKASKLKTIEPKDANLRLLASSENCEQDINHLEATPKPNRSREITADKGNLSADNTEISQFPKPCILEATTGENGNVSTGNVEISQNRNTGPQENIAEVNGNEPVGKIEIVQNSISSANNKTESGVNPVLDGVSRLSESANESCELEKLIETENSIILENLDMEQNTQQDLERAHQEVSDEERRKIQMEKRAQLEQETRGLKQLNFRANRDASTVTPEMLEDVKELLSLFGLPFVQSPMEAEAQCAKLELEGIVDGTVTEDSDIFLFGARVVYKNIFAQKKYVETYMTSNIEKQLGLNRKSMISLALLLGSDYTDGIKGIGIVNALETVRAFPGYEGLEDFKKWVHDARLESITKNAKNSRITKLKRKGKHKIPSSPDERDKAAFKFSHANARKRWLIPDTFPSKQVIEAYENPQVDSIQKDQLIWQTPDIDGIRGFLSSKLGWDQETIDKTIKGPIDAYMKRGYQSRLDSFLISAKDKNRFAAIQSKRMQAAVLGLVGSSSEMNEDEAPLFVDALGNVNSASTHAKTQRNFC